MYKPNCNYFSNFKSEALSSGLDVPGPIVSRRRCRVTSIAWSCLAPSGLRYPNFFSESLNLSSSLTVESESSASLRNFTSLPGSSFCVSGVGSGSSAP
jgi:hypothetical protein